MSLRICASVFSHKTINPTEEIEAYPKTCIINYMWQPYT